MALTFRTPRSSLLIIIVCLGISVLFSVNLYFKADDGEHQQLDDSNPSRQQDQINEISMLLRDLSDRLNNPPKSEADQAPVKDTETVHPDVHSSKISVIPTQLLPLKKDAYTPSALRTLSPNDTQEHPKVMSVLDKLPYMVDPYYKPSKCPKTIASITRYSSWFRKSFKPNIKMFLDQYDIFDVNNYNKLNTYIMPFGLNKVDKNVLGKIINNANFTNPPVNRPTHRCIRCAVVGGGGILNGSNAGEQIDSHDYVFRVNLAHTSGRFAKDVGQKTSFYSFYPESQNVWTVQDQNAAFLFTSFKESDIFYAERMMRQMTNSKQYVIHGKNVTHSKPPKVDVGRVKITHPDFVRYIFTEFLERKGYRPTTGAILVFTALHICDEVTIYGFGYDLKFTIHYFDSQFKTHSNKITASHDVDNERQLWNKLHSEGVIKLFKRDE